MIEFENHDIIIEMTPEGRDGSSVTPRGEWSADEHYYYLDIVTYNGGSYLAQTDVPAGTLPTDAAYWQVVASNAKWGDITGDISDQTDLAGALAEKADVGASYTKAEADVLLAGKADSDSVYSKTEADALLAEKADASDVYDKTEVDDALYLKADKADTYTKNELDGIFDGIDNALDSKADADSVYSKSQTDSLLAQKANSADVYSKTDVDNALALKANTADLGTMAGVDDAPSDDKPYARKNGQWAEVTGGGGSASWGDISGDLSDQTDLADALDNKAPVILNNASGSIASFADGSPAPVTALSVGIEPVQDLHGYSNPWPAGGGKNILQNTATTQTINGVTFTVNADGTVTISGTATATAKLDINRITFAEGNYIASGGVNGSCYVNVATKVNSYGSDASFSVASGGETLTISLYVSNGITASGTFKPMIRLASVSDATFSPYTNICPISGHSTATVTRTGKNLANPNELTQEYDGLVWGYYDTGILLKANTAYTLSVSASLGIDSIGIWGTDHSTRYAHIGTGANSVSYTPTKDVYACLRIYRQSGLDVNDVSGNAQLELSSTATAYEPYQGQQLTIDLDGTRYGGTLDVLTGVMTVDKAIVDLGALSWAKNSGVTQFYATLPYNGVQNQYGETVISSIYKSGRAYNLLDDKSICVMTTRIWVYDTGYNNATDFTASLQGQTAVYTLATPLTVQLTPQQQMQILLGQNAIWASTGNTAVEYRADTRLFIENLTKPTEDDMIANANIASGKYFTIGNSLYLSTASIAQGDTIVPGTNCTPTSLAEALNAINA